MAKKSSLLPHGFKAKAEKIAIKYREELELKPYDPLCGFKLAEHLKIDVFSASEFFKNPIDLEILVGNRIEDNGWSALTMPTQKGNIIIIHNHMHSPCRQQSNLMHELAHIICDHTNTPSEHETPLPFFMRQFNPQHEEEANYLGAALQLSRDALLWSLKKNMKYEDISTHFNASNEMVTFRINSTGVKKQLSFYR